jgi:type IV pilus assembly protein PilA
MFSLIRKRMKGEKGFTLIELLVVIIIIAILAAIAIPTFLGQRQKAQDASAKSLVRNAMTAIESAFIDARTYDPTAAGMLPADVMAIEPTITFTVLAACATAPTVLASAHAVQYTGNATQYSVGTKSDSGKTFGVTSIKTAVGGGTTYYTGAVGSATGW